jgi:nucleoside-diphosphate-sugar epimerase
MRALVTGGTGFTGAALVQRLLDLGWEVRVLDNQEGLQRPQLEAAGAQITIGSVTDAKVVDDLTRGCNIVFHLAAAFRVISVPDSVYQEVNVGGTRNTLLSAQRHGVKRYVYCSTQGVHGHVKDPPGNELSPIAPEDYYQQTKYEGEEVVQEFRARGLPTTILRPTAIYGPGDPGRWLMLFKYSLNGRFLMFGNGETTYHPLYIDNLVDAFLLAADRPEAVGETFIIADEHYHTLNKIVRAVGDAMGVQVKITHLPFTPIRVAAVACEAVCKPLGIAPPLFPRRVDWFRQVRAFDISKAKRLLGYQPKIDLASGLSRTYEWYWKNGYLPQPSSSR